MCTQKKERNETTGNEAREDMKEKKRKEVCQMEKDEKGTKWWGREPMKPNLIPTTWENLPRLIVHAVCAPKVATGSNGPKSTTVALNT